MSRPAPPIEVVVAAASCRRREHHRDKSHFVPPIELSLPAAGVAGHAVAGIAVKAVAADRHSIRSLPPRASSDMSLSESPHQND